MQQEIHILETMRVILCLADKHLSGFEAATGKNTKCILTNQILPTGK